MTSTNYLAFLPKEIEMIIYDYEHQLKMRPVLDDIVSLRNCEDCGELHVNKHNCYECGNYLCEECKPRDDDDFMILCEDCEEYHIRREEESEELAEIFQHMYCD